LAQGGTAYYEWNTTRLSPVTDTVGDLGRSVQRWKDLYLSGGVYVGGTTSAIIWTIMKKAHGLRHILFHHLKQQLHTLLKLGIMQK